MQVQWPYTGDKGEDEKELKNGIVKKGEDEKELKNGIVKKGYDG